MQYVLLLYSSFAAEGRVRVFGCSAWHSTNTREHQPKDRYRVLVMRAPQLALCRHRRQKPEARQRAVDPGAVCAPVAPPGVVEGHMGG